MSVSVIEKGTGCGGCSWGNAGLIVPGHSVPLATPGVASKIVKWIFDDLSPIRIRPSLDLDLISWIIKFYRASQVDRFHESVKHLSQLAIESCRLYASLDQDLGGLGFERRGRLAVHIDQATLGRARLEAQLLSDSGIRSQFLTAPEIHDLEPATASAICGGIYFPDDCHLIPSKLMETLKREATRMGAVSCVNTEVLGFEVDKAEVVSIRTNRGEFRPELVVLAAGSWTSMLARSLKISLPLQPAKGYSITTEALGVSPTIPTLLGDTKIAITPMRQELRISGTLELNGFNFSINQHRLGSLVTKVRDYIRLDIDIGAAKIWSGLRPCTPDGLPVIGWSGKYNNLLLATGHGTLGMTLAPVTGKLVAQLACAEAPAIDLQPFRNSRFD